MQKTTRKTARATQARSRKTTRPSTAIVKTVEVKAAAEPSTTTVAQLAKLDTSGAVVLEPVVRTFVDWTTRDIRSAEMAADRGDMRQVANLCEWILGDDRVRGALDTRVQALLGLDPSFEASGNKNRSKRVVRALEGEEDWWDAYPETALALIHTWGLLLGVAPARQGWTKRPDHAGRRLAMPEFWHPQHLKFDQVNNRWMIKTRQKGSTPFGVGTEEEIAPGDPAWLLHMPYGKNRPWAMGLWRGLARLILIKRYAEQDYARLGESASRNVVTADKDTKSNKEQRKEIATELSMMGRDGSIVLPPGFDYKLVEASAATKDIYDRQIAMVNTAIAVLIRGGNLTTENQGGSLAATESQAEMGDAAKLRFDAQSLTTTIHDQSLVFWALFNFGDANLAPWPVYPVAPKKDIVSRANALTAASVALERFLTMGAQVDIDAYLEDFEIKRRDVKPEDLNRGTGQPLFQYHLDFGVLTINEARERLGLPPLKDGNERAIPSAIKFPNPNNGGPLPNPGPGATLREVIQAARQQMGDEDAYHYVRHLLTEPPATASKGAENGQEYADRVDGKVRKHASKNLAATVAGMIAAVQDADGYEAAKKAIVDKYKDLASPRDLAAMTEAAITMTQLGGHLGVDEDTPKED